MKKIKVGIIGAGFAGKFHYECLKRIYGIEVEISGVTSLRKESRESFGKQYGVAVFEDAESLIKNVDVIDICSPPYVHSETIIMAAKMGKGIICEKPLTGYFGAENASKIDHGDEDDKQRMLDSVCITLNQIATAVKKNKVFFGYAENFVYTPSVQKEREIIEKTNAQILRMVGDESHNGSASAVYGIWRYAGGGSLIGKGVHPLGAMLYLKRIEGINRNGKPIRPKTVTARTHQITRLPNYEDKGFIRTDYHDVEDYGFIHVTFEDGTVADVLTSEIVLGGLYDYVEVFANNHRTRCNISPIDIVDTYNPRNQQFEDIYVVEKCSTKEGWSNAAPDENITVGYQYEMQDFMNCISTGAIPQSGIELAIDTTATTYAAYLSDQLKGKETNVPLIG
ncbi:MAG: oxidoreductase [Planctomycetes bacterium GWF2_41_51]|nr:MAG: oxidoreductase [Planctomycetes bacterium GWF2_41_51]